MGIRTARVRFRETIEETRRDLAAGYDMRAAYERRGPGIGQSYAQFRRYVRLLLPAEYERVRRMKKPSFGRFPPAMPKPAAAVSPPQFVAARLREPPRGERK